MLPTPTPTTNAAANPIIPIKGKVEGSESQAFLVVAGFLVRKVVDVPVDLKRR
jgi:hypothetical protein